jgi:hypothetical protein
MLLATSSTFGLGYLWNEEIWWYLASGRAIIANGAIPSHDPFIYSLAEPAAWVTHSWLWTVIVAGLDGAMGLWALPLTGTLLAGAIVTLVFTRAPLDRFGLVNGLLTALVVVVGSYRFALRAELPGWLLLVAYILYFERERRFRLRGILLLASAQWLWSNLHGGYSLGIVAALAYSVGGLLQERWAATGHPGASPDTLEAAPRHLPLWVAPLLVLASLATPFAADRVATLIEVLGRFSGGASGDASLPIVEWQSTLLPTFAYFRWLYGAFLGVGAASFLVGRGPRRLARLLLFVAMAVLAAYAVRFLTGLAITAALVVMGNLRDAGWPLWRPARPAWEAVVTWLHALATTCFCLGMLATAVATWELRSRFEVGPSADHFFSVGLQHSCPGAADYILAHDPPGPIFNDMNLGGYLIYRLYPGRQLFIDGRILDRSLLDAHRGALYSGERWRKLADHFGFQTVVLSNLRRLGVPLRTELVADPEWKMAYVDPQAVVFVRRNDRSPPGERAFFGKGRDSDLAPFTVRPGFVRERWIQRAARPLLREVPLDLLNSYLMALSELGLLSQVEALATRALEVSPEAARIRAHRGIARLRRGRTELAVSDLRQAMEQLPEDLSTILAYALALNRLGQSEAAVLQVDKALRLYPSSAWAQRVQRQVLEDLAPSTP